MLNEIEAARKELAEKLREYVRSQKEEWRRVPYLALKAVTGGFDDYTIVYRKLLWPLEPVSYGLNIYFVDCAEGSLVRESLNPLSDAEVAIVASNLAQFDASRVLHRLAVEAVVDIPPERRSEEQQLVILSRYRTMEKLRKDLKLEPLCVRT